MEMENQNDKGANNHKQKRRHNFVLEWIFPIIGALVIAILVNKFIFYKVYIPSESMEPTLNVGDQLFVSKIYNLDKIKRGDILVFRSNELDDTLIKRVIGLPGDRVCINDGVVSVNGQVLNESYIDNHSNNYGEYEVPAGKYFFLGDNRSDSFDSSRWNNPYIDESDIISKAIVKVYPFDDFGFVK